jgi:hypothetical protein
MKEILSKQTIEINHHYKLNKKIICMYFNRQLLLIMNYLNCLTFFTNSPIIFFKKINHSIYN